MINDILDLSRIESGAVRLELTQLDLQPLVMSALSMVSKQAEQRQVKLTQRLDPAASHVWGDATRIRQVLTNLLSNAVKYNVEGGNVHVSSRRLDADTVEIVVTDTGLGLSQKQLDQLFQPFNRLGRETSGIEGTGIGLVIARRLAELMSGTLAATSVEGSGSSFALRLPRAEPPQEAPGKAEVDHGPTPTLPKRRVVYVEDNAANVALMRGILAQRPQLQLEVYGDASSGLAAVLDDTPDLLLLDMQLPDGDGLDLLRRLRAEPVWAAVPVLAVSANALPDHVAAALEAGALRYLTKPVDVQDLLSTLDRVLGQA
jgi:CheY-like chemotaxis protein/anti-sigma regulatory factor (Ser/Thr protein kinase)